MFPSWLGNLHPKYKTPGHAILLVGGLSTVASFRGGDAQLVGKRRQLQHRYFLFPRSCFFLVLRKEPGVSRPFRVGKGVDRHGSLSLFNTSRGYPQRSSGTTSG